MIDRPLDVLVADDELPALDELEFLLRRDPRIGAITRASSGTDALARLREHRFDAAFLDIHMPGASGLELARALGAAATDRPAVVFVTADDEHAVSAFELAASDYLLKPVREERLRLTIDRLVAARDAPAAPPASTAPTAPATPVPDADPLVVTVSVGSTVHRIASDRVVYAQAQGDYTRLHTDRGRDGHAGHGAHAGYLLRMPISELEERWRGAGFLRVHRSYLVAVSRLAQLRLGAQPVVVLRGTAADGRAPGAGIEVPVSRRLLPGVRAAFERGAP